MSMFVPKPYENVPKTEEEAIQLCVLANRILSNEGVLDAFGHVSVRNPENPNSFFQSRSLSPELVTANDILELDLDGTVVKKTDFPPYGERIIHAAIMKARPEVNAVFHGHPHSVIPFSSTGVPIRSVAHFGALFCDGIPLYDDYDVSSGMIIVNKEEGERLARVLGNANAVLMRDHGCCVVGENVPHMVMGAIYLRDSAAIQLQTLALGQPKYLTYEESRAAAKVMTSVVATERAWSYWVSRAKRAYSDL